MSHRSPERHRGEMDKKGHTRHHPTATPRFSNADRMGRTRSLEAPCQLPTGRVSEYLSFRSSSRCESWFTLQAGGVPWLESEESASQFTEVLGADGL
jgi:hypothetical protein